MVLPPVEASPVALQYQQKSKKTVRYHAHEFEGLE